MIKNSPVCPAFAASPRTKHSLWALIDEEDAGKIDTLMNRDPLTPRLGQGFNFLKHTYKNHLMIQSSLERRKKKKNKQYEMERKVKLAGTKMNP